MADLARFQSTAVDTAGNVIAGAFVTVRNQATGNIVSLYSDRAGTIALGNPFNADSNGYFGFHVAGGTYRIAISDGISSSEITWVGVGRVQENEVIQISSNGNVGIGTSSPASKLHVSVGSSFSWGGPWDSGAATFGNSGALSGAFGITYNDTDGASIGAIIPGVSWKNVNIRSNDIIITAGGTSERFRVTSGGSVGIGTSSPNASAILDVTSTTQGILFPRMTTTQRDAISSPANGLVLYNTTDSKLQVRAGGSWVNLH